MKILVMSPIELPFTTGARYTGLERLAVQFAEQWDKLGHEVAIIAHKDTSILKSVKLYPCDGYETIKRPDHAEIHAYQQYQSILRDYDVIWDISHLHLVARMINNIPVCSVFSANPEYEAKVGSKKAPYNLISWSKWGVGQIRKYYHQNSVYQETIMIDPEVYKPGLKPHTNRFLTLGRMSSDKGNLNAVMLCKKLNLPLDVVGGRGSEHTSTDEVTTYEKTVTDLCDGKQIKFYGEVSEEQKVELLQTGKALIYATDHIEITSHKVQESMFCGAKVIIPNTGGMPEIVTQGVDGYLCNSSDEYVVAINNLDKLDPSKTREQLVHKYSPEIVASNYVKLFEKVIGGERW